MILVWIRKFWRLLRQNSQREQKQELKQDFDSKLSEQKQELKEEFDSKLNDMKSIVDNLVDPRLNYWNTGEVSSAGSKSGTKSVKDAKKLEKD